MQSRVGQSEAELWGKEKAHRYAEGHKKYTGLMYRGIVRDVRDLKLSGRFLEVGAGPGFLSVMLAQKYPEITVTAVDLSPDMADVAGEYIAVNGLGGRIKYIVGDAADRDLVDGLGRFDFVYSTFSLHHWESPRECLRNLWDAVEDGGFLYINDFRRMRLLAALPIKDGVMDSIRAAYSPEEIRSLFRHAGITRYRIKRGFPFLFQTVIAKK
jgi:SAM-dependent methyltransferase